MSVTKKTSPARRALIALGVVVALILGVIGYRQYAHKVAAAPIPVAAQAFRTIGAGVDEATAGPSNAKATTVTETPPAFGTGAKPLATALTGLVQVTPSGDLGRQSVLRFKLNHKVASGDRVFIATREANTGPWQFVTPTISADGLYAIVTTRHFSFWQTWLLNIGNLASTFSTDVVDTLTGRTEAPDKPKCTQDYFGPNAPKDNYKVASTTNTSTIYWCFGVENSQHILRVVNRQSYPIQFAFPKGVTVLDHGTFGISAEHMANLGVSAGHAIVLQGDSMTFKLNLSSGETARFVSEFSGWAQQLYTLDVGFDSLVAILTKFGLGDGIGTDTPKAFEQINKMLGVRDCLTAVRNGHPGEIYAACFPELASGDPFGKIGTLIVLSVVTFVTTLATYFTEAFQSMYDSIAGKDRYTVEVGNIPTDPFAAFEQPWGRHASSLSVKKDGTGALMVGMGAGSVDGCGTWCAFNATLKFTPGSNGLTGTYTKVWYTTTPLSGGSTVVVASPPSSVTQGLPNVGDTMTLSLRPHDMLRVEGVIPGSDWCGPHTLLTYEQPCGA